MSDWDESSSVVMVTGPALGVLGVRRAAARSYPIETSCLCRADRAARATCVGSGRFEYAAAAALEMDTRTPEQRRRIMQAVKSKNTGPELTVRRLLHGMGYRYRLHRKDLPGRPDIVFVSRRKAIFVHGCFWHGHGCSKGRLPKSRLDYWRPKIEGNVARDRTKIDRLRSSGWDVLVVWQCEIADLEATSARLQGFVDGAENAIDIRNGPR